MKKNVIIIIFILLLFCVSACQKQVTLTFETNGGSYLAPMKAQSNIEIKPPKKPTKEYHFFEGWYINKECTKPFGFTKMPKEDMTIYVRWEPLLYTISFDSKGGSYVEDIIAPFGSIIKAPLEPVKEGYKFVGWYTLNNEPFVFDTMPKEDMSLLPNLNLYPQIIKASTYLSGDINEYGDFTIFTEKELKQQFINNLDTFEEKFRGNTVFNDIITLDESRNYSIKTYSGSGTTYLKAAADYIQLHNLATVTAVKRGDEVYYWTLDNIKDELINGYGIHLNCENSPVTHNPFYSHVEYSYLLTYYPYYKEDNYIPYAHYSLMLRNERSLLNIYKFLYTSHEEINILNNTKILDENKNPIICGGYHATDENGNFLYDENGKPVQALFKIEPPNNDIPIYAAILYAKWE